MSITSILWILLLFTADNGVLLDKVVARIDNEIILLSELSQKVEMLTGKKVDYNENDQKVSAFYNNILNELVEDRIIQIELQKMGQDLTESELKSAIDDIRKQRGFSEEDFAKLISKEGLSFEQYKSEVKRQVRRNKFIALKVRTRVKITNEDAKLFYDQEFGSKKAGKVYDISMIFVSVLKDQAGEKKSQERLELIKKEISDNKDFADIARRYSDDPSASSGGHIGKVTKGDMREEFEKVIFNLKENEISHILKFPEGYYIFRLNNISSADIKSFDEAKDDIKRMLFEKEILKQYSYVIDSLKKKYTIYTNLK